MFHLIGQILLLPLRLAILIVEILGRTLAIIMGLFTFGIGALFCMAGPLILLGAPLCLIGVIVVVKAV